MFSIFLPFFRIEHFIRLNAIILHVVLVCVTCLQATNFSTFQLWMVPMFFVPLFFPQIPMPFEIDNPKALSLAASPQQS